MSVDVAALSDLHFFISLHNINAAQMENVTESSTPTGPIYFTPEAVTHIRTHRHDQAADLINWFADVCERPADSR